MGQRMADTSGVGRAGWWGEGGGGDGGFGTGAGVRIDLLAISSPWSRTGQTRSPVYLICCVSIPIDEAYHWSYNVTKSPTTSTHSGTIMMKGPIKAVQESRLQPRSAQYWCPGVHAGILEGRGEESGIGVCPRRKVE